MSYNPSNNQLTANAFDNLPVAIYTCDIEGYLTAYNKAAVQLWGREPEIGKDRWGGSCKVYQVNGDPVKLETRAVTRAIKEKRVIEGDEVVIERPDGSTRNVLPSSVPIFDINGELTGATNTLVDITEQRRADEQQSMLAAIIETSGDAIISKTLDGVITSWNDAAERLFGYTSEEVKGKNIKLMIPPELIEEEAVIMARVSNGEKINNFETYRLTREGKQIPLSITISPMYDHTGRVIGASKIARNISAQKAAEEALHQYTQNLEALYSVGRLISEDLDVHGILQKVTDETTKMTGAEFGAFFYSTVNKKGDALMLYTLSGAPKEAFEKLGMPRKTEVFSKTFNGEGTMRVDDITKDPRYGKNPPHQGMPQGHLPVVSYLSVPVVSKTGTVIGGLFFGHPKPAVFKKEHETLVASVASQAAIALDNAKLYEEIKTLNARKDEFIGIASHELKTPLTSMSGYLQIMERNMANDPNVNFVRKTKSQLDKLLTLVNDLLDVSKIHAGKLQLTREKFDLQALVGECIEIAYQLTSTHRLVLCNQLDQVTIMADRHRIEQVIINLLTNAIKYSPKGSQVNVDIVIADNLATVMVKDFGIGIDSKQQEQIFSRFFRADGLAQHMSGLGLGLYISKEIIERHNGKIGVRSEPGNGSEFYFSLPLN